MAGLGAWCGDLGPGDIRTSRRLKVHMKAQCGEGPFQSCGFSPSETHDRRMGVFTQADFFDAGVTNFDARAPS